MRSSRYGTLSVLILALCALVACGAPPTSPSAVSTTTVAPALSPATAADGGTPARASAAVPPGKPDSVAPVRGDAPAVVPQSPKANVAPPSAPVSKADPKADPKSPTKADAKADAKGARSDAAAGKPEVKADPKAPAKAETKPEKPAPLPLEPKVAEKMPAKPAPKPAPAASPVDASSGWVVQLGSFASRENAEKLARELKAKKFKAFVSEFRGGGKTLWRVRVGPEQDRARIDRIAERLQGEGHKGNVAPAQ